MWGVLTVESPSCVLGALPPPRLSCVVSLQLISMDLFVRNLFTRILVILDDFKEVCVCSVSTSPPHPLPSAPPPPTHTHVMAVSERPSYLVPIHPRNAPSGTRLMKSLGFRAEY